MGSRRTRIPSVLAGLVLATVALTAAAGPASAAAPLIGDWRLKGSFANSVRSGVRLGAVGLPAFQITNVNGVIRRALAFDIDEGVRITGIPRNARSSYSIMIGFEIDDVTGYRRILSWGPSLDDPSLYSDDGVLDLYNYVEDTRALIVANGWSRVLITRDGRNGLMRLYIGNRLRTAWVDHEGDFRFGGGIANLFIDDGGEDASGTIAFVKLWRGIVNP